MSIENETVLPEFKAYANFSVRVDRFFNVVNIYGMHHNMIKHIHSALPAQDKIEIAIDSNIDSSVKTFLITTINELNYIATTNIFIDQDEQSLGNILEDTLNFAFYTCYCFQWSLFEDFSKTMIRKVIDANVLKSHVVNDLESNWRRTKAFFDIIHFGDVFGRSPFKSLLPVMGWVFSTEEVGYEDLNSIRNLRNSFIHGVENPDIISENILEKQRRYERSMWILRKFGENIQWEVQHLIGRKR